MADYQVNLAIALKGARDLQKTRVETKLLQRDIRRLNKDAQIEGKKVVKNFDNMSKVVNRARDAVNQAAIGTDLYRKAIQNAVKVEEQFNKQQSVKTKLFKIEKVAYKEGISFSQAKARVLQQEIKAENELARAKLRNSGIGSSIRRGVGSAVGSGIIGGGFPLLFGQGPLAAAAGGIGGVAGGALAAIPGMGQFGFALSIAGTAIGSAMEDLTEALKKPEENIQNLINKLGLSGTPTEELALKLEKMGAKSSAAKLLLDEFNEKMGKSPEELMATTKQLEEFKNKVNLLGTEITLFLSTVLIPFIDAIGGALDTGKLLRMLEDKVGVSEKTRIQQEIVNKSNTFVDSIIRTNKAMGIKPKQTRAQMLTEFIDIGLKEALGLPVFDTKTNNSQVGGTKSPSNNLATQTFQDREILPLKQALTIEQNRLTTSSEKLNLMKEQFELTNLQKELEFFINEEKQFNNGLHDDTIQKLKAQVNLQTAVVDNAKALADPFRELSNIIAQDIGNGIKGLIQGTETLNNVLRNVLNKLADAALNMAIFGNVGGQFQRGGGGILGSIFRAEGGPVKRGGSFIVGERGPELFTPGVSGMITPNHALGGSTSVVVNVDASGSSVEGDEPNAEQLGRLIGAVVQSELIKEKRPGGLLG